MSNESLHKSFGNVDQSHLEGLVFFEGHKPNMHVEKALQAELDQSVPSPAASAPHIASAPQNEAATDSSHLEGLVFFEGQKHDKASEIHRFGLDKHLGGAINVQDAAATPQPQHHQANK
jgi:hypothetical protein